MTSEPSRYSETRIDRSGRVVIPAWVRRRLDLRPDTELRVSIRDGALCLEPRAVAYRRARDRLKRYFTENRDDVTELWNERRDEAGSDD